MTLQQDEPALKHVAERLHVLFPEIDRDTISSVVEGVSHRFDTSPIRDFLPILIEREATAQLSRFPRQRPPA